MHDFVDRAVKKPDACRGCSYYADGEGFVPDSIPDGAEVVFVGQNPGADEELTGVPFIGRSGQYLRSFVQQYLGGRRVGYANILKCRKQRAGGTKEDDLPKPGTKEWRRVVSYCMRCHWRLGETLSEGERGPTPLVVLCGNHARAALAPELKGPELHVRGTWLP